MIEVSEGNGKHYASLHCSCSFFLLPPAAAQNRIKEKMHLLSDPVWPF